jgi:hypothetical protein
MNERKCINISSLADHIWWEKFQEILGDKVALRYLIPSISGISHGGAYACFTVVSEHEKRPITINMGEERSAWLTDLGGLLMPRGDYSIKLNGVMAPHSPKKNCQSPFTARVKDQFYVSPGSSIFEVSVARWDDFLPSVSTEQELHEQVAKVFSVIKVAFDYIFDKGIYYSGNNIEGTSWIDTDIEEVLNGRVKWSGGKLLMPQPVLGQASSLHTPGVGKFAPEREAPVANDLIHAKPNLEGASVGPSGS